MDHASYQRVIEACALRPDLEMLPAGDQTEIGEKGINLSGGQKQRVSLARAVYNSADVYFLDDPLSAVDSHVGKHIFQNVIGPSGMLHKKTRVLVTHGITYLPDVDIIVVLKDGEVTELGTYRQLLEKKGAFAEFLVQHLTEVDGDDGTSEADLDEIKQQLENTIGTEELQQKLNRARSRVSESQSDIGSLSGEKRSLSESLHRQHSVESSTEKSGSLRRLNSLDKGTGSNSNCVAKPVGDKLIEVEKAETGSVKWRVYSHYLRSIGLFLSGATIFFNMVFQAFSIGSNVWLSEWSNDKNVSVNGTVDESKRDLYLGVYGALGAGQVIAVLISSMYLALGTLLAATYLHSQMLSHVLTNPLSFFDTTPTGRILNRFSKDIDTLDNTIPHNIRAWLTCLFSVIATLVVISYSTPIFITVIVPIGILYYFIQV
ncbi:hypothetical protein B7P43_G15136 [Cryptotermes secundus]|uniref:ABC transmembrane type-1 domain-containing protein n=1 Tax=Cryptotermes secundus TaxID=105785 RepID=A0A2J7Q8A0_9NEOP|nr:hypothetical protein B7P43_G15136 [Cryptotermes secundus]